MTFHGRNWIRPPKWVPCRCEAQECRRITEKLDARRSTPEHTIRIWSPECPPDSLHFEWKTRTTGDGRNRPWMLRHRRHTIKWKDDFWSLVWNEKSSFQNNRSKKILKKPPCQKKRKRYFWCFVFVLDFSESQCVRNLFNYVFWATKPRGSKHALAQRRVPSTVALKTN